VAWLVGDRKASHASMLEAFMWILLSGAVGLKTMEPLGTRFHLPLGPGFGEVPPRYTLARRG